ncbi:hypothetical protein Pint_26665 [Pistacia integerrima]|uniref:Uncharacterized protein n=1 Tax=Pistacia integerrima TaxID=434235 RepID=A0ACC0YML9_9ROSI|nr:hypothetical protein Pint_26665 [Pistacia integerrima]
MGKRKIEIKKIEDSTKFQITFSNKRDSLIKKAHEISILCDIDMVLVIFSAHGRFYEFCSCARSQFD